MKVQATLGLLKVEIPLILVNMRHDKVLNFNPAVILVLPLLILLLEWY